MESLRWYYPESIDEALDLLSQKGTIIHGGGTFILKGAINSANTVIDLQKIPLKFFTITENSLEIGSLNTYSDIIENLSDLYPDHILVQSLTGAASTPLRNRITLGGSICAFPIWSDIIGPLIALDSDIELATKTGEKILDIVEYIKTPELRRNTIILGIKIHDNSWNSLYFSAKRTHFDLSAFNITVLWKNDDDIINDIRIVVVGNTTRYVRLSEIEDKIRGHSLDNVDIDDAISDIDMKFSDKNLGSGEYLQKLFAVEMKNALISIQKNIDGR